MIDMDGTVVDVMLSIITDLNYNIKYSRYPNFGRLISMSQITDYGFEGFKPIERQTLFDMFSSEGRFANARAYPYAVEVIRSWLNQPERYKVKFVTHFLPHWNTAYREKTQWLRENFSIDLDRDFIVCKDRSNLVFDILIDDCWQNIVWCLDEREYGDYIIPARPWNACAEVDNFSVFRPADWPAIAQLVEEITNV
jgi:5'(3')-deoxyribonucleotidase